MDKKKLEKYKPNCRELKMIDKTLEKLRDKALDIPTVKGKVSASRKEFPYIEQHVTVEMAEPKASHELTKKIAAKEARREQIAAEVREVEEFIESIQEGEERQVFELYYLQGMKQREVADIVGLERSSISKKISDYLQLSHNSQKNML